MFLSLQGLTAMYYHFQIYQTNPPIGLAYNLSTQASRETSFNALPKARRLEAIQISRGSAVLSVVSGENIAPLECMLHEVQERLRVSVPMKAARQKRICTEVPMRKNKTLSVSIGTAHVATRHHSSFHSPPGLKVTNEKKQIGVSAMTSACFL